ncbi:hypothetical protein JOB18_006538 [Solea senegalensis]|uniref:Uncharacterized protein n=1 Tax=Solea senegalensis TaxID=28829 RepID=A0AAV6Q2B1_SOLSE|nr:hypothetical protein JOB18_006538 [Solea senegalensis]
MQGTFKLTTWQPRAPVTTKYTTEEELDFSRCGGNRTGCRQSCHNTDFRGNRSGLMGPRVSVGVDLTAAAERTVCGVGQQHG